MARRNVFTFRLADTDGKPILDDDGNPTDKCMSDDEAAIANGNHLNRDTGVRWRRLTRAEMLERR